MKCPTCGSPDNKVIDSVKTYALNAPKKEYLLNRIVRALRLSGIGELARMGGVARRRRCRNCGCHFITHEKMVQIQRRKK
jgi:transcriptional regulator NrdR family protein